MKGATLPSRAIRDWLSEYKALPPSELHQYARTLRSSDDVVEELYQLFEDDAPHEVLEPVCHQLFDFYRCGDPDLKRFTLDAIPVMMTAYLRAHSLSDKKRCSGIEACLLGVYNLEVLGSDGKPKVKTYTIPTLAVASVYHEPPSLATLALTESALLKHHSEEHLKVTVGPRPQVERINAQNRLQTLASILQLYNEDIGHLSPRSHFCLCKMASKVSQTGFENLATTPDDSAPSRGSTNQRPGVQFRREPRIQLASAFLVELLNGIYFSMFNGQAHEGIQALNDIHNRATYELYADVLLVTNAIRNSLQFNPSGQPQDGPMGISISLSPTQNSPAFSKSAITNASFRAKKLPEDIDVPDESSKDRPRPPGRQTSNSGSSGGPVDTPPHYDDVVANGNASSGDDRKPDDRRKLPKPLKSIMKKDKTSKPAGMKQNRRSLNTGPTPGEASPKHSVSVSGGLSGSQLDHDAPGLRTSASATAKTFQAPAEPPGPGVGGAPGEGTEAEDEYDVMDKLLDGESMDTAL